MPPLSPVASGSDGGRPWRGGMHRPCVGTAGRPHCFPVTPGSRALACGLHPAKSGTSAPRRRWHEGELRPHRPLAAATRRKACMGVRLGRRSPRRLLATYRRRRGHRTRTRMDGAPCLPCGAVLVRRTCGGPDPRHRRVRIRGGGGRGQDRRMGTRLQVDARLELERAVPPTPPSAADLTAPDAPDPGVSAARLAGTYRVRGKAAKLAPGIVHRHAELMVDAFWERFTERAASTAGHQ